MHRAAATAHAFGRPPARESNGAPANFTTTRVDHDVVGERVACSSARARPVGAQGRETYSTFFMFNERDKRVHGAAGASFARFGRERRTSLTLSAAPSHPLPSPPRAHPSSASLHLLSFNSAPRRPLTPSHRVPPYLLVEIVSLAARSGRFFLGDRSIGRAGSSEGGFCRAPPGCRRVERCVEEEKRAAELCGGGEEVSCRGRGAPINREAGGREVVGAAR
uniref:Uncharacterized protein n=1 Tax=Oryza meridionalis TaxID=40149 RepID=A0A0E0CQK5_9ORYZ